MNRNHPLLNPFTYANCTVSPSYSTFCTKVDRHILAFNLDDQYNANHFIRIPPLADDAKIFDRGGNYGSSVYIERVMKEFSDILGVGVHSAHLFRFSQWYSPSDLHYRV